MLGFLAATSMLIGALISFSIAYKKRSGRNLFKDIFNDMRDGRQ